jgi:hypothetical protein
LEKFRIGQWANSITVVEVSTKRQNREEDSNTQENDNETGDYFDIGIEEEKERALLVLMKAYEHHISLSCDYKGHTLMELHEQRANEIKEELTSFISREFINVGVEKKRRRHCCSGLMPSRLTHLVNMSMRDTSLPTVVSRKYMMNDQHKTRKRILEIMHSDNHKTNIFIRTCVLFLGPWSQLRTKNGGWG